MTSPAPFARRCGKLAAAMRVAALYDIHGNLPALEAVMDEVRRADIDRIVVGGDVVPGPMPRETIAYLRNLDLPVQFIHGNGDREVLARRHGRGTTTLPAAVQDVLQWTADLLTPDEAALLATWPSTLADEITGVGKVLFCHATPRNDTEIFTKLTAEDRLRPIFDTLGYELVVCGHTHMQFDRTIGRTRVVNAGSIGMPFGEPGAYWLLLGPGVEHRRTDYDLEAAAARIRRAPYPQAEHFAARNVLAPPSEAETLAGLSRAELT